MKQSFLILLGCLSCLAVNAETDKYRCMFREDPSTSMTIAWNQVSGNSAKVYYDLVDHGTQTESYAYVAETNHRIFEREMDNHFVRLTGLLPDTVYYFVIQDDNSTSQRFSFRTIPNNSSQPLSFIAGGDSRNNWPFRRAANLLVSRLRPDAVFFGGDMTDSDTGPQWRAWFDDWQLTIGPDGRMTPIVVARGNHESTNEVIQRLFDVPKLEVYYALTFGGDLFRAYTLNTLYPAGGSQAKWLADDLADHTHVVWKAAQYHQPMRPHTAGKPDRDDLRDNWAPLFEAYGMNFVVECDAHMVKMTHPIVMSNSADSDLGFERDDERGVIYVGEGCWGAPLRINNEDKAWTKASGMFNQVKWIFVNEDRIELRTVKTGNAPSVGQLDDHTRFEMPENIDLWAPNGESVLVIERKFPGEPYSPNLEVVVYPNPVVDWLQMSFGVNLSVECSIYDPMGRLVYAEKDVAESIMIDVSQFGRGIYYLRIINLSTKECYSQPLRLQ